MFKLFNHYLSIRTLLLVVLEAGVLYYSVIIGFQLRFTATALPLPYGEAALFSVVMLIAMSGLGLYQPHAERFRITLMRLSLAYAISLVISSAIFYVFPDIYLGRGVMALTSVVALMGIVLVRLLFTKVTEIGLPKRRVLVLGNGAEAEQVIRLLQQGASARNIEFAGLYPVSQETRLENRTSSAGLETRASDPQSHEELMATLERLKVSEIVIATRERRGGVLPLRQLLEARLQGIRVIDLHSFYEREAGILPLDALRASWMIFAGGFDQSASRDVVKRIFDIVVALLLLVMTLPIMALALLAVRLESGKPVFYSQIRVGQGGRTFRIVKIRSMRRDAEADGKARWASTNDDRITRVGAFLRKTRIDELPQLWAVLRGDMSFVGPRPERPEFVQKLREQVPFYDVRHSVKPGVTGWAQVRFWYGGSMEDSQRKLEFDLYYVKNHSFFLDLLILLETIQVVALGKGAR
jgi:sugar transferase (PEP-CTERM system associated)